jgi:Uncharacterized protein conserved in bacteria
MFSLNFVDLESHEAIKGLVYSHNKRIGAFFINTDIANVILYLMKKIILVTVCVLIAVFAYIIVNNDGSCNRKFSRTLQTIDVIDDDIKGYSKGVSGAFAGISNDMLILAGGCNFPDIPVSEGGKKVYYSSIYGMRIGSLKKEKWEKFGDLPFPLAYGVTVESGNSLYLIGGNIMTHLNRMSLNLLILTAR